MRALVLQGGAMRGVFTAGVLDGFAERGAPPFDVVVGVSAGAACASSYLAGQHGRNYRVFVEHMTTRAFVNPWRALRGGSYFDMDFVMGPLPLRIDPLNMDAVQRSPTRLEAVATHADTARPAYLPAQGPDLLEALLASVAIPVLYRGGPVRFRGERYFDGGLVDPVPIGRALRLGADYVTVVLTNPRSWRPKPLAALDRALMRLLTAGHGAVYRAALRRHVVYRQAFALFGAPPAGVTIRALYPPEGFPVSRYTQDRAALKQGYQMGREAGLQVG